MEKEMKKQSGLPHDHGTHTDELLAEVTVEPDGAAFEEAADVFSLLGDSTRLKIFWLLCHSEDCVVNIAAAVGMSPPAVSHHLKLLKQAKLIQSRKCGKEVHYKAADSTESRLLHAAADSVLDIKCPNE